MTASSATGIGLGFVEIPTNKKLNDEIILLQRFGQNALFVGKNGNDDNNGLSFFTPFLTFSAAINRASELNPGAENKITIFCFDSGIYADIVVNDPYVHIFAPEAQLNGAIIIANESRIKFGKLINTGTEQMSAYGGLDGVAVQRIASGGDSHIDIDEVEANGLAGFINLNAGSELMIQCQQLTVNAAAGVGSADVAYPGHLHCHIAMISLIADGAIGVGAFENDTKTLGSIDHIIPENGAKDTIGIYVKDGIMNLNVRELLTTYGIQMGGGLVNINCNYINPTDADSLSLAPYVISGGELNMFATKMIGTPINTGGTANIFSP